MTIQPLNAFSEVVDEKRRWNGDWYSWLGDMARVVSPVSDGLRPGVSSDLTIYVDASRPDDSGSGLTPARAKKTIQAGLNLAALYGVQIKQGNFTAASAGPFVKVKVADGNYVGPINLPKVVGSYSLYAFILEGNVANPANCVIDSAGIGAVYTEAQDWLVTGFKFTNTGAETEVAAVYADNAGLINIGVCEFGSFPNGYHIFARAGARIVSYGNELITGGARCHWLAHTGGVIQAPLGYTVTLTGTPNFSYSFAGAGSGGVVWCGLITFSGGATGTRAFAYGNGVVDTSGVPFGAGSGATYLPGNSANILNTGGQYI